MRTSTLDETEPEHQLTGRGLLARILGRVMRVVTQPWHMCPVGLLFGLGFDTATEVSLLVLTGCAAPYTLPWYAILTLPILFAAGMSLFDAADGMFTSAVYRGPLATPQRPEQSWMSVTRRKIVPALSRSAVNWARHHRRVRQWLSPVMVEPVQHRAHWQRLVDGPQHRHDLRAQTSEELADPVPVHCRIIYAVRIVDDHAVRRRATTSAPDASSADRAHG